MATVKSQAVNWFYIIVTLSLLTGGGECLLRRKRLVPIVPFIAKFAIQELMSFGIDSLVKHFTETGNAKKLDTILRILNSIKEEHTDFRMKLEELKDLQTVHDAGSVERDLLLIYEQLDTFFKSYKTCLLANTSNDCHNTLENEKRALEMNLMRIPNLLTKLHLIIEGDSIVSAGRIPGLACDYVRHVLRELQVATSETYNLSQSLSHISSYKGKLMKLQVSFFQLYNLTCSANNPTCDVVSKKLEDHLQLQEERFQRCTPHFLSHADKVHDINIIHPQSGKVVFNNQKMSIVTDGTFDWDRIHKPQNAGVRCPLSNSSDSFSWEDASADAGYYLRQKSGCYLSFDRPFVTYKKSLPTFWSDNDKIDRKEFLICKPANNDAVRFLIAAAEADINTTYSFREVETEKYLNIHAETTNLNDEIDKKLTLVLLLDDGQFYWNLALEGSDNRSCNGSSTPAAIDTSDGRYLGLFIGIPVGVVFLVIVVVCYCFFCRRQEDQNENQNET